MIHRIKNTGMMKFLTVFVLAMLVSAFTVRAVRAATIVDGSYSIAVSGQQVDLDGMDNVLVYLKYTEEGEINATNVNFTFQLSGSTSNLLTPDNYTWKIDFEDDVAKGMFTEWPVPEGGSYTRSYDIAPNRDANGNYVPSVKKATITVSYDGTVLANKSIFVITPISMDGFDTEFPTITSSYFALRRTDDNTEEHASLTYEAILNISSVDNITWYYRPISSNSDDDWKEIPKTAVKNVSDNTFVRIETYTDGTQRKVKFSAKETSGGVTLVGRIKENGYYSETVLFDMIVAAYSPAGQNGIGRALLKDATYGTEIPYNSVVRHLGDLNVWYDMTKDEQIDVFKLNDIDREFIANYYGEVVFEFCPVEQDATDQYSQLYEKLKCVVEANVVFDVIKAVGNSGWTRVAPDSTEILSVGSAISIMTNARGTTNPALSWAVRHDGETKREALENYNDEIKSTGFQAGTYSTGYRLLARSGGELYISCELYELDVVREFKLIVTDGLEIDPSAVELSVGDSINIEVTATDKSNPIYWEIVDALGNPLTGYVEFTSDPSGKTIARIRAVKAGIAYVTASQSTNNSTMTVKCKVTVSDSLESAMLYGDIEQGKVMLPVDETAELTVELWDSKGNIFEATEDDIKWVSLSPDIASVEMDPYEPTRAIVTANSVGKAYVAVVANDISQTQIDIVEIIVVSPPTGIVLNEHNVEDSLANKSYRLIATIEPEGAQELEIEWTSSDETIATVNENGLVTYKKAGEVIITARVDTFTDSCILKIITPVTSIKLNESEKTLMVGETLSLVATVSPDSATHKDVIWESSDTRIAVVDEKGIVTAVGAGTAHITCRAFNSDVTASCIINVYQQVLEIKLNYETLTVRKGTVFWLYASVIPDTALNKEIVWESSLPGVASVDEFGQITALASGTTTITATSLDTGASDSCILTVSESVTGISLNIRQETIEIGEKLALIPTVKPVEAENKAVTYRSSDPTVASVDENGVITGLKGGTVIIVCQTVDRGLIASCIITVNEYISDIRFVDKELYIIKGEKKTLQVDVMPKSATNQQFKWTTQNENILHIDDNGVAYGVDYGTVIVTVATTDGSEKKDTCKITVIKPVESLVLTENMIKVEEGKDYQLNALITPSDASVHKIIWTSSDTSVAVVDNTGKVTGVKEGVCTITATAEDGAGAFDRCAVTVTKTIRATSITVNPQDATMIVGESREITARMKPTNTTEVYSWISSDDSVATVDENGKVTAVGTGSATITAVTDISGIEGSFKVTVIALNTTKVKLEQYDSYDLYLDGTDSTVTWYSRNKRVATVNARGQIVARQSGTTYIVARVNGKRVMCEVTVTDLP